MTNEELAICIQNGESGLTSQLWDGMRGLVCLLSNRFYVQQRERCDAAGVTVDDLTQEGFLALLDAVKAYNPDDGYKLSAFLRFPLLNRFKAATGGRENHRKDPLNNFTSLDAPISDDGDGILADTVPSSPIFSITEIGSAWSLLILPSSFPNIRYTCLILPRLRWL